MSLLLAAIALCAVYSGAVALFVGLCLLIGKLFSSREIKPTRPIDRQLSESASKRKTDAGKRVCPRCGRRFDGSGKYCPACIEIMEMAKRAIAEAYVKKSTKTSAELKTDTAATVSADACDKTAKKANGKEFEVFLRDFDAATPGGEIICPFCESVVPAGSAFCIACENPISGSSVTDASASAGSKAKNSSGGTSKSSSESSSKSKSKSKSAKTASGKAASHASTGLKKPGSFDL